MDKKVPSSLLALVEDKEAYKKSFVGGCHVTDPIKKLLTEKLEGCYIPPRDDYDSHSWPFKQADRIGYMRALKEAVSLLP